MPLGEVLQRAAMTALLFLLLKKLAIMLVAGVVWVFKMTFDGSMDLLEEAVNLEVAAAIQEGREVSQGRVDKIFEELKAQKRRKKG
jgi:hypothetical protein